MIKVSCEIIQDLLPLYAEGLASVPSQALVEEHLTGCPDCTQRLEQLTAPPPLPDAAAPLKQLKRHLWRRRLSAILLSALLVAVLMASLFSFLTAPQYFPYESGLISVTEAENGLLRISFRQDVTRYDLSGDLNGIHISAWTTLLDQWSGRAGAQDQLFQFQNGISLPIYYVNDGAEDVQLWGEPSQDIGVRTLPRLVLSYYFILAAAALLFLLLLRFLLRKNQRLSGLLEILIPAPLAYLLGHLLIKGWRMTTCALQYDLSKILLATLLLYCAGLLGRKLWRTKANNANEDL